MTGPNTDDALFEFDDEENGEVEEFEDDREAEDFDDAPICGPLWSPQPRPGE